MSLRLHLRTVSLSLFPISFLRVTKLTQHALYLTDSTLIMEARRCETRSTLFRHLANFRPRAQAQRRRVG